MFGYFLSFPGRSLQREFRYHSTTTGPIKAKLLRRGVVAAASFFFP